MIKLLSEEKRHPKIIKNQDVGVFTRIMHLAPARESGFNVCPQASEGCKAACLHTAGFHYARKYEARIKRTRWFFEDREAFMAQLVKEIKATVRSANRRNMLAGIRLNGTSDIRWERIPYRVAANVMDLFPEIKFMDYTKIANRKNIPENYRLVFSRSESNDDQCVQAIDNGMNVAVVFAGEIPDRWSIGKWANIRVVDGDEHDWRYGEYEQYPNEPIIIGLKAKGRARHDRSGFVVHA